jgi:hypothetical protein
MEDWGLARCVKDVKTRRHRVRRLPEVSLTPAPTLARTKQERELRLVACVTTFQAVQKVSSFRRLALKEQAGQGVGF